MQNAKKDSYDHPSLLAVNKKLDSTIAVTATNTGALNVSSGKVHKKTIQLNLTEERNKRLFHESFNEITFSKVNGEITLYLDAPIDTKALSIRERISLETTAGQFYISNPSQPGKMVEIWLWE
ncbi:hypothetical protein [Anaerophilus nitritogenes]|uniref:hypothetical protein n=1 Tax=Anaerophilus nitritogenes TaxID=2498136 RepID=UPI00101D2B8E|nr:hypothetical protein [Anaerophilus nitritogenes]